MTPVYFWDRDTIAAAAREWTATHGHTPRRRDWMKAGRGQPVSETVYHHFGSWPAMLKHAGLYEPRHDHGRNRLKWDQQKIADALIDWTIKHGRPPHERDWWYAIDGHPNRVTVRNWFGSWNKALLAAGITSVTPGHGGRQRLRLVNTPVIETPVLVPAGRIEPLLRDWLEEGSGWDGGNPDCKHTIKTRVEGHKCTRCGARYQQGPNTMLNLASMAGLSPRRLWVILNRHARPATRPYGTRTDPVMLTRFGWVKPPQPNVELDTVDKLLLGMGVHPRNTELADLYDTEEAA